MLNITGIFFPTTNMRERIKEEREERENAQKIDLLERHKSITINTQIDKNKQNTVTSLTLYDCVWSLH